MLSKAVALGYNPQPPRSDGNSRIICPAKGPACGNKPSEYSTTLQTAIGPQYGCWKCWKCLGTGKIVIEDDEDLPPPPKSTQGNDTPPEPINVEEGWYHLSAARHTWISQLEGWATARGWPVELAERFARNEDAAWAIGRHLDQRDANRIRMHARSGDTPRPLLFLLRDAEGEPVSFIRRRPTGTKGRKSAVAFAGYCPYEGVRVLGHLPTVLADDGPVLIVEGEADWSCASAALAFGLGTDHAGVIGVTTSGDLPHLGRAIAKMGLEHKRFHVVPHLGDKRDVGLFKMRQLAAELAGAGHDVVEVTVPTEDGHGDLADVLEKLGIGELEALLTSAFDLEPGKWAKPAPAQPSLPTEPPSPPPPTDDDDDDGGNQPLIWYDLNDTGNGDRLIHYHGEDIKYCRQWGKWLVWDGSRWQDDNPTGEIFEIAKTLPGYVRDEADAFRDTWNKDLMKRATALRKHATRLGNNAKLEAALKSASTRRQIRTVPEDWDQHPTLLNNKNVTIDLDTGKVSDCEREHLITHTTGLDYDPDAKCPAWDKFLSEIFAKKDPETGELVHDAELVRFVQKLAGYSATGLTSLHLFVLCYGSGSNGKSTFLETLQEVFGDYGMTADFSSFTERAKDAIPNDIARLQGARFVTASEPKKGKTLDEGTIKKLTGGDMVTARFLRQEYFEFKSVFTLWLGTNHMPDTGDNSRGFWRRVLVVPFKHDFSKNMDEKLPDKLKAELPGILRWVVEGTRLWRKEGLELPKAVVDAIGDYRSTQDQLRDFFDECCVLSPTLTVGQVELYAAYTNWAKDNHEDPKPIHKFRGSMAEQDYKRYKSAGKTRYRGIGLKATRTEEEEARYGN